MSESRGPSAKSPRLRLRVTATAETLLRGGHPWLFANSVREQNRPGICGELAVVYDRNDAFLAVGLRVLAVKFQEVVRWAVSVES